MLRGMVHLRLEQFDEALQDFNFCMEAAPERISGYYNRAQVYAAMKCHDLEITDYERILALDPDYEPARLHLKAVRYLKSQDDLST